MNKILVEFHFDAYYGALYGLFITTPEELQDLIGKECYFGEVLGKHSEVSGTVSANDFTVHSNDQQLIEQMLAAFNDPSNSANYKPTLLGYNPFDYINGDVD